MKTSMLVALSVLVAHLSSSAATRVFQDDEFDLSNYEILITNNGGASVEVIQSVNGGNPGAALSIQTLVNPGNPNHLSWEYILNLSFMVDPGESGPIVSIDYTMDRWIDVQNASLGSWGANLLLRQDGMFYRYNSALPVVERNWRTGGGSGLSSQSFSLITNLSTGATNASMHPDFSGSAIYFGMLAKWGHASSSSVFVDNRFDNVTIAVTTVPEPATTLLWGGALIVAGVSRAMSAVGKPT